MADVMASNEQALTDISKKADDIITEVKSNFDTMNDLFDSINTVLEGNLSDSIVSKYTEFRDNFDTIVSNLSSYSEDVVTIRDNHADKDNASTTSAVTINKGGDIINVNRY